MLYSPDTERQKILTWVSSMNFLDKHHDISDTWNPGTGEWFLNTDAFQQWESSVGQVLWCPGIPGAGKTVLSSLVINHLRAHQLHEPVGTVGVAWVYLNYKDPQSPDAIFLSLIQQLAKFSTKLYAFLKSSYKNDPESHPSARQFISNIHDMMQEFSKIFIIIDALDECSESFQNSLLNKIALLQEKCLANILITSRDHIQDSITFSDLKDVQTIHIHASDADITKYVETCWTKTKRLAQIIPEHSLHYKKVVKAIVESCKGMYVHFTYFSKLPKFNVME